MTRSVRLTRSAVAHILAPTEHVRTTKDQDVLQRRGPGEHRSGVGVHANRARERPEREARIGLRSSLQGSRGGRRELGPSADHRVRLHVGRATRGTCRSHHFIYGDGDVDVLPAGWSDVWEEKDPSTSLILELSPLLLRQAAGETGRDPEHIGLVLRYKIRDPRIEHIAWALETERREGHPSGLLYAESLGIALSLHLLGTAGVRLPPQARGLSKPQLRHLAEYIENHIDRDLSLDHLARVCGLSASHLKATFRRSMGLPIHRYVIQRRVERARTLLARGELPASQIALESGFSHQSHMARWIRRILGVTPTAIARKALAP